jgi:hypothetical protein
MDLRLTPPAIFLFSFFFFRVLLFPPSPLIFFWFLQVIMSAGKAKDLCMYDDVT